MAIDIGSCSCLVSGWKGVKLVVFMHSPEARRRPRVTVLMAVYNGERYLRESIDSVLRQTFSDFEFIIVNDGSTDSSRDIVLSYNDRRIRLTDNLENIGLTQSLNRGLLLARGEYVARHDADDISHPSRFEKQAKYLDAHPEIVILGSQARHIDERGRVLSSRLWARPVTEIGIRWVCMFDSPFIHSSVMMRCHILKDNYGGYNPAYDKNQDHELWTRIVYDHPSRNLVERLIDFRVHSKSLSATYTIHNIEKFAATVRKGACAGLGQEPPEELAHLWVRINNPNLKSENLDIKKIVRIIDSMHQRFVTYNQLDMKDEEILYHKHCMLVRIAYNALSFNKVASLSVFLRVCREDLRLSAEILPKYVVTFVFGKRAARLYRRIKSFWYDRYRGAELARNPE